MAKKKTGSIFSQLRLVDVSDIASQDVGPGKLHHCAKKGSIDKQSTPHCRGPPSFEFQIENSNERRFPMDDQHPKYDQRPKRRKDKDNPYVIFIDNAESLDVHYYIRFRDGENVEHCLEIKKELFDLLDSFELEDLRHLNAVDNHYEHSELTESTLNKRAFYPPKTIDAIVNFKMECEELHSAIRLLPITQRRRLILYYFGELTHEQIAEMEGCSHQAVEKSIKAALKKLKKFLS